MCPGRRGRSAPRWGLNLGAGTAEWPAQSVRPSSWAPGKSGFSRAQQVGVDCGRRREPPGVRGRSAGRSPPGRRAAPRTRPGGAGCAGGWNGAPARASEGEVLPTPARSPGGGFPGAVESGYCLLAKKERLCWGSICLVWGNISYPTLGQHNVISRGYKVFGNFIKRFMALTYHSNVYSWQVKIIFLTVKSGSTCQMI